MELFSPRPSSVEELWDQEQPTIKETLQTCTARPLQWWVVTAPPQKCRSGHCHHLPLHLCVTNCGPVHTCCFHLKMQKKNLFSKISPSTRIVFQSFLAVHTYPFSFENINVVTVLASYSLVSNENWHSLKMQHVDAWKHNFSKIMMSLTRVGVGTWPLSKVGVGFQAAIENLSIVLDFV